MPGASGSPLVLSDLWFRVWFLLACHQLCLDGLYVDGELISQKRPYIEMSKKRKWKEWSGVASDSHDEY